MTSNTYEHSVQLDVSKCTGCKLCEKNCEQGAIHVVDNHAVIDYDKCNNCGKCADVCKIGSVMRIG